MSVRDVMRIEKAELVLDSPRLLLFGPNGGGKSSLIYAIVELLYRAGGGAVGEVRNAVLAGRELIRRGSDTAYMEAETDEGIVKVRIRDGSAEVSGSINVSSISFVDPCRVIVANDAQQLRVDLDICRPNDMGVTMPEIAEWVRNHIYLIGFEDFYVDKVKHSGTWISVRDLAYGYRRVLGMLVATYGEPDIVIVEGFEAGMHYDTVIDLLDLLTSLRSLIILESHVALSVKAALNRGWTTYYVRDGEFIRIRSMEDLRRVADREARAYASA